MRPDSVLNETNYVLTYLLTSLLHARTYRHQNVLHQNGSVPMSIALWLVSAQQLSLEKHCQLWSRHSLTGTQRLALWDCIFQLLTTLSSVPDRSTPLHCL